MSRRINFADVPEVDERAATSSSSHGAGGITSPGAQGKPRVIAPLYSQGDEEEDEDDDFALGAGSKRSASFPTGTSGGTSTTSPPARLSPLHSSPAVPTASLPSQSQGQGAGKKPRGLAFGSTTTIPLVSPELARPERSGTPGPTSGNPFERRTGGLGALGRKVSAYGSGRRSPGPGGLRPFSATNGSGSSDVDSADPDANFFRIDSLKIGSDSEEDGEGFGPGAGSRAGPSTGGVGVGGRPSHGRAASTYAARHRGPISPNTLAPLLGGAGAGGPNLGTKGVGVRKGLILDEVLTSPPRAPAASEEGRERIEWQTMLASVLGGEILKGEKSRIGGERPTNETFKKEIGNALWWQIRAKVRGRSEEEERRRVKERRDRTVDAILEEVERFRVNPPLEESDVVGGPRASSIDSAGFPEASASVPASEAATEARAAETEQSADQVAMEQILSVLAKLSLAESLYPHVGAFRAEKPLYDSPAFQARVDALASWSTVVRMLHNQLAVLQKWTGSTDLDVTRPNTTAERALVGKSRYHPLDSKGKDKADQAADDSTFIERILKEDSLRKTFNKRAMLDLYNLVYTAKQTVIDYRDIFQDLGLAGYKSEIVMLIAFPARLIVEALKVRLDAANKLENPSSLVIDDMIDNFRVSLLLACEVKAQYLEIVEPDPDKKWDIPPCLGEGYDDVMLDSLKVFFKLLQFKLRSGSKAIYFKETEILNSEWEFLNTVAEAVEGGDVVVAEHYSSLTNKLMVRVTQYFETQLRVPLHRAGSLDKSTTLPFAPSAEASDVAQRRLAREQRPMDTDEMVQWFSKILDAVRLRYRKLQSFARRLTQRFDNSAEYDIENIDMDLIIEALVDTDHFLVYTQTFEPQGTYIIADASLRDRPDVIHSLLYKAFSAIPFTASRRHGWRRDLGGVDYEAFASSGEEGLDVPEDVASYLLILTPNREFLWTGAVMTLNMPYFDLAMSDNRIRLIADGPVARLTLAKETFANVFIEPGDDEPFLHLECIVEQQAHLPRLQRELKRISRSTHHLSECIVESVAHVRKALRGAPGTQDLVENWYAFASDHGHRVGIHMNHSAWSRFSRLLMRLAISWVAFICDQCDPTDRKTFRWAVNALEYAMVMTRGNNILHLDQSEFALLRSKVASCMALLISHFDILGARSSLEAKKEAEKLEAIRRLQRLQEAFDDAYGTSAIPESPADADPKTRIERLFQEVHGNAAGDRSIRLVRDERLRLIAELEQSRVGLVHDQRIVGQVLDEQVSEDRSLVFLASSTSNIALRWQQGGFIGGGANGNVYIGFNLDSGGIMAVKEIRVQDLSNSPTLYKQIKDESDVMQMLSHPNIVDYYGIEVHRDRVYIFEEYCEGGSLANLLEHGRIEDEEVILVYTLQMLQGLEYLHSKGVEHRDVKPDNILLGANSTIKFVDFGAAKVIIKGNKTMARSRAVQHAGAGRLGAGGVDGVPAMNSLAGTPMYMAPEVIKNERSSKLGAMDIWSMGCVILEFATGRKPWSNLDNEWAIMFHIGIATQHPPLPEPGQLSDLGIDFIEQCLTLDAQNRPTASELLQHPWLTDTMQQLLEHSTAQESYFSQGTQSLSSTLVASEGYDSIPFAVQLAAAKEQTQEVEDLSPLTATPNDDMTPNAGDDGLFQIP